MSTTTELSLTRLDVTDRDWASFVDSHDDATVFHSPHWCEAIQETFGYPPAHLAVTDRDGTIEGLVPGMRVRDGLRTSTVLPFGEYGFPLLSERVDPVDALELLAETGGTRIVKETNWSAIRGYSAAGYGGVETGTAIRLGVDRSFERLWHDSFAKDVRRCVRTARDSGVSVTTGDVETLYPIYRSTMGRLGSPPFPRELFERFVETLGDAGTILTARLDTEPIAAVFLYEYGDTSLIWTPASLAAYWDHRPNHLLYLTAIERACESERSVVDFGRSRDGSSVHSFKKQFGGTATQLVSFVSPPHHTDRASLETYGKLGAITPYFAPIVTHPTIGPFLKRFLHE